MVVAAGLKKRWLSATTEEIQEDRRKQNAKNRIGESIYANKMGEKSSVETVDHHHCKKVRSCLGMKSDYHLNKLGCMDSEV